MHQNDLRWEKKEGKISPKKVHSIKRWETLKKKKMLGSKDLGSYVFRTLMCIVGKPWPKQDV